MEWLRLLDMLWLLCCGNQVFIIAITRLPTSRFSLSSTHATRNKSRVSDGVPQRQMIGLKHNQKKGHCLKSTMLPSAPTTQPAVWCFACGLYGDPFYATPAPDTPVPSTRIYTHDTGHIPFPYDPSCFQIFPLAVLSFNLFAYSSGSSIPLR